MNVGQLPNNRLSSAHNNAAVLRARVLQQARTQPSLTRDQLAKRNLLVIATSVALSLLVFVAVGGVRSAPRPVELVVLTVAGPAVVALAAVWLAFGRGNSMLGRPKRWLMLLVISAPLAVLVWKVLVSACFPRMMVPWVERPGFRCLQLGGLLSIGPLLGAIVTRWRTDPCHPHTTGAALGAAVGICSWVLTDLWCPVANLPHLLLGHALPLLLVVALGAVLGGRFLTLQRD